MTPFQWAALGTLTLLLFRELRGVYREGRSGLRWLRLVCWLTAGVAIARPDFTMTLAQAVGIGRGADLVLYLVALSFLGVTFYFYARMVRLQRQLTELARHLALQEAKRGAEA